MDPDAISRLDLSGMFDAVRSLPKQLHEGRARAAEVEPRTPAEEADVVVVAGMGGSAISGDLLAALAEGKATIPIVVCRGYTLPAFVNERSIVVVSSYSGNTEESLSAMDDAFYRGAQIVCISSGGEVSDRARRENLPLYVLPGGLQPRAALGFAFSTLLTFAEQTGLLRLGEEAWEEMHSLLEEGGRALSDTRGNSALELANQLRDRVPFIYSGNGITAPVNTRWCCQLEENAKVLAHGSVLPEQNHNEIVGWEEEAPLHSRIAVIALRDRMDHPRIARRLDLTREILQPKAGLWLDVATRGGSDLARMLYLVQFGDWVSLYLALIRGIDPTPVRLIDRLKTGL